MDANTVTTLYIKNMVCDRCKTVVRSELQRLGYSPQNIELGEASLTGKLHTQQINEIQHALQLHGFELIDDRKNRLTERVKNLIIELVHQNDNSLSTNLSDYLSGKMAQDYSHISSIFSQVEALTIEQYYILQKIERVKELLVYDELNLNEIAMLLNYSSASHLTKQFKKVTGLTPSFFKSAKKQRRPLDDL